MYPYNNSIYFSVANVRSQIILKYWLHFGKASLRPFFKEIVLRKIPPLPLLLRKS
jgi:hypothetical protein